MSVEIETFDSKQPSEELYYLLDFTKDFCPEGVTLTAADTVASCTITMEDSDGTDVSSTMLDAGDQSLSSCYVYFTIKAGTDGETYKGTAVAVSTMGQTAEIDFYITVTEV